MKLFSACEAGSQGKKLMPKAEMKYKLNFPPGICELYFWQVWSTSACVDSLECRLHNSFRSIVMIIKSQQRRKFFVIMPATIRFSQKGLLKKDQEVQRAII